MKDLSWVPFPSPPQVLNLTRQCIQRHRDFVVPLIIKYGEEWLRSGYPIFRPVWWLSPTDPTAFTIEDEFLIGDEVGNAEAEFPQRVIGGNKVPPALTHPPLCIPPERTAQRLFETQGQMDLLQVCNLFKRKSQQAFFSFLFLISVYFSVRSARMHLLTVGIPHFLPSFRGVDPITRSYSLTLTQGRSPALAKEQPNVQLPGPLMEPLQPRFGVSQS